MKKIMMAAAAAMVATPAMAADWKVKTEIDEFDGTSSTYLISQEQVKPTKELDWPYKNKKAYMYYDCNSNRFVINTKASNLTGGTYSSDSQIYDVRMKIDGNKATYGLITQRYGSDFLTIDINTSRKMVKGTDEFLIQLPHYSDGNRVWKFDISGFDKGKCN